MVGGLSIEYSPGMYSDPDLSKKLYTAGVRIFKGVAKSRVYHFQSKSTKKLKKSFGRHQFLLKWGITPNAFFKNTLHIGEAYKPLQNDSRQKLDAFLGKLKILKGFFSSRRRQHYIINNCLFCLLIFCYCKRLTNNWQESSVCFGVKFSQSRGGFVLSKPLNQVAFLFPKIFKSIQKQL